MFWTTPLPPSRAWHHLWMVPYCGASVNVGNLDRLRQPLLCFMDHFPHEIWRPGTGAITYTILHRTPLSPQPLTPPSPLCVPQIKALSCGTWGVWVIPIVHFMSPPSPAKPLGWFVELYCCMLLFYATAEGTQTPVASPFRSRIAIHKPIFRLRNRNT